MNDITQPKLCFYYQVWHTNQLSTFEALKQLRLIYPTDELVLVIAGLKRKDFEEYDKNFTQIIKQHFNITTIDYLYIDDYPTMNRGALYVPPTSIIRDEYIKFAHVWLDQFVSLPSDDVDIIINGSDDWVPLKKIPIDFDADVCGRISSKADWMKMDELEKFLNIDNVCWIQHGHYMNLKKLRKVYNEENKQFIENLVKSLYPPEQSLLLDYVHALWNAIAFENMIHANYVAEISSSESVNDFKDKNWISIHGSKILHNKPISQEMIDLNIMQKI